MTAVEKYRALCEHERNAIPLFSQAWWLDAVAGKGCWDVVLVEKNGVVHASMPYIVKRRFGLKFIGQPILTQHLGPWIRCGEIKLGSDLSRQKDLYQALIEKLPSYDYFFQNWNYELKNWLPFYWKGFRQTTRYTYVLSDLSDESALWAGFGGNIKGDIKKAAGRFGVQVKCDFGIKEFYALNQQVFKRQGMPIPYTLEQIERLDQACAERNCRRIFTAVDAEGRRHAAVYLVWDDNCAYYLMGGGDSELRNSGATSLCMWEAIRFAAGVSKRFDFEGSMLEPIERFIRGFGAEQVGYFSLTKTPSRLLRAARFAQEFLKP